MRYPRILYTSLWKVYLQEKIELRFNLLYSSEGMVGNRSYENLIDHSKQYKAVLGFQH